MKRDIEALDFAKRSEYKYVAVMPDGRIDGFGLTKHTLQRFYTDKPHVVLMTIRQYEKNTEGGAQ